MIFVERKTGHDLATLLYLSCLSQNTSLFYLGRGKTPTRSTMIVDLNWMATIQEQAINKKVIQSIQIILNEESQLSESQFCTLICMYITPSTPMQHTKLHSSTMIKLTYGLSALVVHLDSSSLVQMVHKYQHQEFQHAATNDNKQRVNKTN